MPTHASSNHHPRISPPGPTARNFEFEIIFSTTTTSDGDDERRARHHGARWTTNVFATTGIVARSRARCRERRE